MTKKDIIIIKKPDKDKILTSTERDILYDEIKNKYNISNQHIENFKKGDDILFDIPYRLEMSSIDTILLKNILKYTYPIINAYPNKNQNIDNKTTKENSIITLDYDLHGLLFINKPKIKLELIKIPSYTEIEVIGLVFPFFSEHYYSIFKWFFQNNSIPYMYTDQLLCKNDIFRNNINIIKKYISININNLLFQQSPNDLINLSTIYKNKKCKKYDEILSNAFLFNSKHNIDLFNRMANMILYYLNFYDRYLLMIFNQHLYKSNYKLTKLNYFYNTQYYKNLPILVKNIKDIELYNNSIDNIAVISNNYTFNTIYTFKQLHLLLLYDYIYLYGFDSKIVKNYIENLKSENIIEKQKEENEKKILKNKLININYERISENKFPNLFNENHKDNIFNSNNLFNILKLPKKYKDIILLEYKKQESFLKAFNENECPHLKLLNQFRYTTNTGKKNYYFKLLKEFINVKKENQLEYYKCNNCNFNIICPHVYETQLELLKIDNEKLSNKLNEQYDINQKIINKYMSNAPVDFIYYCKICSEQIGKSFYLEQPTEFQDNTKLNTAEDEDELRLEIINNTYHIVLKYLNFNILTINKKKLIFNIIDLITPFISDLEMQLHKNKIYDEQTKSNQIKLNIIIYIFASIIQIMTLNKELTFNDNPLNKKPKTPIINKEEPIGSKLIIDKEVKPEESKKSKLIINKEVKPEESKKSKLIIKKGSKENPKIHNIRQLLQQSFLFITNSQNVIINKLSLTSDNIKQLLISAYTNIVKKTDVGILDINTILHNITGLIISNPIYSYVHTSLQIYPLIKQSNNNNIEYKTNNNRNFNFEKVLNKTNEDFNLSKIKQYQKLTVKQIDNFSNIIEPIENKFDEIYNNIYDKIPLPNFTTLKNNDLIKDSELTSLSAYKYMSYKNFRTYLIESIYKFSPFEEQRGKYSDHDLDIIKKYNEENKLLLKYDKNLQIENVKYNLKPYKLLKSSTDRLYKYHINNLNLYFCLNGQKQDFDTYIFKNTKSKKTVEYNRKDLDKLVNDDKGEYFAGKYILIDKYNSQCKEYLSKIQSQSSTIINKNDKIIINNMNKLNLINSFYNYYNIKCPIKDTHTYKNISCTKCGITKEYINNQSESFYNKYKTKFNEVLENKEKRILVNLDNISKEDPYYTTEQYIKDIKKELDISEKDIKRYQINNKYISILSKKYKINEKYLINIGLSEDKDYLSLTKVDIKDEEIQHKDRLLKLKNILRLVIIYYNKLKYSYNISKFDNHQFENLIHTFTKHNGKLKDLNKLKELPFNFYNLIRLNNINLNDSIDSIKLITNVNNIIMNIIWDTIYFILEQAKGGIQTVINNFVEFLLKRIMEFDEIYSSFNLIQLKKEKESSLHQDANVVNMDYGLYEGDDDDDDIDLENDIINYDAFDLDLVDNDPEDFDSYD